MLHCCFVSLSNCPSEAESAVTLQLMEFKGDCDSKLDEAGYCFLTFEFGGGPTWMHNSVLPAWSGCLGSLQIQHQKEPHDRYTESEDRPDTVMYDSVSSNRIRHLYDPSLE